MPRTQNSAIFASNFRPRPYWWDAYEPEAISENPLPKHTTVTVVGAGYAGLNAAIELANNGVDCVVLDAAEPGFGASTRNGGMVSGGVNVGKGMIRKPMTPEEATPFLNDAAEAFTFIEDVITKNKIDCGWHKTGYFLGAWCKSHFDGMATKSAILSEAANAEVSIIPREEQRQHIGSDYYHGGMLVRRAAHLHPALYYKGLLQLAQKAGVPIATRTPVTGLNQDNNGSWQVKTPRGIIRAANVIIATNGYTGDVTPQLKRRVVPVGSYIIATEELPADLAKSLSPQNESFADTRRVLTYYRLSHDGKRMIFGGRARFGMMDPTETAPLLYRFMLDRYPQLNGVKITNAWTGNVAFTFDELPHMGQHDGLHYALGCNGSGIAMMSYLGHETARKIMNSSNRKIAFDLPEFPTHPLYSGTPWFLPLVGAWFRTRDWVDRRFN